MEMSPPTVEELQTFRGEVFPLAERAQVEMYLQQATDALWVFTGADSFPTDARLRRLFQNAILDLTLWLLSRAEHRDEINSPFTSERIGSYSYSKMQRAADTGDSGIYWLDLLFKALKAPSESGEIPWVTSERVFNPEGLDFADSQMVEKQRSLMPDPSEPWGF